MGTGCCAPINLIQLLSIFGILVHFADSRMVNHLESAYRALPIETPLRIKRILESDDSDTSATSDPDALTAKVSGASRSLVIGLIVSFVGVIMIIVIFLVCRYRCRDLRRRRNVMMTSLQHSSKWEEGQEGASTSDYTSIYDTKHFRSADAAFPSSSCNAVIVHNDEQKYKSPTVSTSKPPLSMNDFEPIHVLGEGSFGKVLLVQSKHTERQYAMKILKKAQIKVEGQVGRTLAERYVLERLDCPYIVKLHGSFQSENKLYFVLDYHPGGDLYYLLSRVRCFPENQLRFYASNIVVALEYLHANNVIYRDLKPENILLAADGRAVLTDFGLCKDATFDSSRLPQGEGKSKLLDSPSGSSSASENKTMSGLHGYQAWAESFVGTPEYLAPEIIKGEPYGPSCDFYALGVTLYELATGQPPFYHTDAMRIYRFTLHGTMRVPDHFSPELKDLLLRLLERDVTKRLGSSQGARDVMNHPFFYSVDWTAVREQRVVPPFAPSVNDSTINVDSRFANMPVFSLPETSTFAPGNPLLQNALAESDVDSAHIRSGDQKFAHDEDDDGPKLSSTFEGFSYRADTLSSHVNGEGDLF